MRPPSRRQTGRDRLVSAFAGAAILCASGATIGCNAIFGIQQLQADADASVAADAARTGGADANSGQLGDARTEGDGATAHADEAASADGTALPKDSRDASAMGDGTNPGADRDGDSTAATDAAGASEAEGAGGAIGAEGAGGATGVGGAGGSGGRSETGGSGGSAPLDAGNGSQGGSSVFDGSPDQGTALDGGTITVSGRVIDSWHIPIAGASVAIGSTTVGPTDSTGHFEIAGVTPPYDITFYVPPPLSTFYVFEGLTRADPTLQADHPASPQRQYAEIHVTGGSLSDTVLGRFVFATDSGVVGTVRDDLTYPVTQTQFAWAGPALPGPGVFHLLRTVMPGSTYDVDQYSGYASIAGTLQAGASQGPITLDLTDAGPIPSGSIEVTTSEDASVRVYVHFDANGVVDVIQDMYRTGTRTYHVPNRDGWTYSVAAWHIPSGTTLDSSRIVHKGGLSGASNHVDLTLPTAAEPGTPANDATGITTGTPFLWVGPADHDVNTLSLDFDDFSVRVVTTRRRVPLPDFHAFSFNLPSSKAGRWYVQVHSPYASTDEATGPTGYVDAFNSAIGRIGPDPGDGTHTYSRVHYLTTAP